MARHDSPYIVGDFWLDKRPDGRSANWCITWYDARARTTRYRSTGEPVLERAKAQIEAHALARRQTVEQKPEDAIVGQILATYWAEHGSHRASAEQIKASIQHIAAFLEREEIADGRGATRVAELKPRLIKRFIGWREGPHRYDHLNREGETVTFESPGVSGEAINRNLDDLRAALGFAHKQGDLTAVPFIAAVPVEKRSGPRERVLEVPELAAMLEHPNDRTRRMIVAAMGTLARPEAILAWHIPSQFDPVHRILDTNPPGKVQTKKHNPIVPVCDGLLPWLERTPGYWIAVRVGDDGERPVASIKTAWRHMRASVGLGPEVVPKTIRHTMNTYLRRQGVPEIQVETMAGHRGHGTNRRSYTHIRPDYLSDVVAALDMFWNMLANHTTCHVRTSCGPLEARTNVVRIGNALKRKEV